MERVGQFRRQHHAITPNLCETDDPRGPAYPLSNVIDLRSKRDGAF